MSKTSVLFQPLKIGAIQCANRIIMSPLTRSRATMPGFIPNALMAEYYAQRASAGLIIAEATMAGEHSCGFMSEPGIYSQPQIDGWKVTTEAVHAKGGHIFLQIYLAGRVAHSVNNNGRQPVGPSAIANPHKIHRHHNPSGVEIPNEVPRALLDDEIPAIAQQFVTAAKNARAAGFDGVEVYGANGYFINQFLSQDANKRTEGPYAVTSIETRCKLLLDVVQGVCDAIGKDRVGLRISPLNQYNMARYQDPEEMTTYICKKVSEIGIAYLHLMRADFFGPPSCDVVTIARKNFNGGLISNMGYKPDEAASDISDSKIDAVAFGTLFLANPNLPKRIAAGAELNSPNPDTFYFGIPPSVGYTDYPFL